MFDGITNLIGLGASLWPKALTNVTVEFAIKEKEINIVCDDKALGVIRVRVFDADRDEAIYLEGENDAQGKAVPSIGFNLIGYSKEQIFHLFHLSRCKRELERTGDFGYARGFDYHRTKFLES